MLEAHPLWPLLAIGLGVLVLMTGPLTVFALGFLALMVVWWTIKGEED